MAQRLAVTAHTPTLRSAARARSVRVGVASATGAAAVLAGLLGGWPDAADADADRALVPAGATGATASACVACHAAAHPGFAASGHAEAAIEPWYELSVAVAPPELRAACDRCHAPEGGRAGVTCVSCHLAEGAVRVATRRPLEAPHPTRFAPELSDGRLCADCHRVELPIGRGGAWLVLQDTPSEHAAWRRATGDPRGCVDCHVRAAPLDFAGVRDARMLARAVEVRFSAVRAEADGSGANGGGVALAGAVTVANLAGHGFPTGSELREGWVRVDLVDTRSGQRFPIEAIPLAKRGDPSAGEAVIDTRLAPAERRSFPFRARLPAGAAAPLAVECRVELALVSLAYPDDHPLIPPGEPRVLPVARAVAFAFPEEMEEP